MDTSRATSRIRTVDDARRIARRRLPRVVFDYIDGAAETETTMHSNRQAFESVGFVPSMAAPGVPVSPSLATTVFGSQLAMPIVLAPVGFTRAMSPGGDVAGASAARAAGTVACMSTMSGHSIEEVADAPQPGNRERDLHHGVSLPLRFNRQTAVRFAPQALLRPRWVAGFARDGFSTRLPCADGLGDPGAPMTPDEALLRWFVSPVTWDDFGWLRETFDGPVIAKGVLSAVDARRAVDAGASGIVVSNHGGRQLDSVAPSLVALREVLGEVGGEVEVALDSGIRRGSDVAKALALGAKAVLVGRPWAFGLAAAGEPGVARVLEILRAELERTLRLLGVRSVDELRPAHVTVPEHWSNARPKGPAAR